VYYYYDYDYYYCYYYYYYYYYYARIHSGISCWIRRAVLDSVRLAVIGLAVMRISVARHGTKDKDPLSFNKQCVHSKSSGNDQLEPKWPSNENTCTTREGDCQGAILPTQLYYRTGQNYDGTLLTVY